MLVCDALSVAGRQDKKTAAVADRLMGRGKRRAEECLAPAGRRRRTLADVNGHQEPATS